MEHKQCSGSDKASTKFGRLFHVRMLRSAGSQSTGEPRETQMTAGGRSAGIVRCVYVGCGGECADAVPETLKRASDHWL
jgi:hypothetical protein